MRRLVGWLCACVVLVTAGGGSVAFAAAPVPSPVGQTAGQTGAWILVDADTGAVLDAASARTPMRPASVIKVLTALIAVQQLPANAQIPVSARTEAMPAMKIDMHQGQTWPLDDTLRSLLMVSANDAAAALAERVGGSLEGFADVMNRAAVRLHLADGPVLQDPAGLDDWSSVRGGNLISARDLAIITRAALAVPLIRQIVSTPEYHFHGVDGKDHRLLNHNKQLKRYQGAIGVKTGYTSKAGNTFIAAATRGGRTMIAIVLKSSDHYATTAALLDRGFATPVSAQAGRDRLPAIAPTGTPSSTPAVTSAPRPATTAPRGLLAETESFAQGDRALAQTPTQPTDTGQRNFSFELPHLGATGAVLLLGVLPAAWIMFVARPRTRRRRRQRERQRGGGPRKRYQHRRWRVLSLFAPRLRGRGRPRKHARPPGAAPPRRGPGPGSGAPYNQELSRPRRPEDGPYPPISTASWPEDPLPPSRFDALVRERVAR